MSKVAYANSGIANTNSFQDWLDITNDIINDMATSVVTAANTAAGGVTSGNVVITDTFTSNTLVANAGIRGGNSTSSSTLIVTSNLETSNAVVFSGDVTYSGSTKSFIISTLTTNVNSTQTNFNANVTLKATTVANTFTTTSINFLNANSVFIPPSGNTGTRPSIEGSLRYNTETDRFEGRDGGTWSYFLESSDASSFQANSATLTALAAVTPSGNNFLMATNSSTYANVPSKNYGVGFLNTTDANNALSKLNLNVSLSSITGISTSAQVTAGTNDTTIMTPVKSKEMIGNFALGVGQTWQDLSSSRSHSTVYRNTTGRPIEVAINGDAPNSRSVQVSQNGTSGWMSIGVIPNDNGYPNGPVFTVPNGWYYRVNGSVNYLNWSELR